MSSVSIIGAGSWGTALATVAQRAGSQVTLWSRSPDVAYHIAKKGINPRHLSDIQLSPSIVATSDLQEACQGDILVLAVPAQVTREVTTAMAPFIKKESYIVIAAKGIEIGSGKLMSEVIAETLPDCSLSVLSGPTFADEVAKEFPTAATLASENLTTSQWLVQSLSSATFRVYASDDLIGAQIGGAFKNVLAIATGIISGRGMGFNAPAALMTRGLAEIIRLAEAKGGKAETLSGLSGVGDICLTCTSEKSRNMAFGKRLGAGTPLLHALEELDHVVEGIATSKSIRQLSKDLNVDMPIFTTINGILNYGLDLNIAMEELLTRPPTVEFQHTKGEN